MLSWRCARNGHRANPDHADGNSVGKAENSGAASACDRELSPRAHCRCRARLGRAGLRRRYIVSAATRRLGTSDGASARVRTSGRLEIYPGRAGTFLQRRDIASTRSLSGQMAGKNTRLLLKILITESEKASFRRSSSMMWARLERPFPCSKSLGTCPIRF